MPKLFVKAVALAAPLVLAGCYFAARCRNPFEEVEWLEDHPGAGDRYATFTPVLSTDHSVVLGPAIGADYGELFFEDLNHDGVREAIVETSSGPLAEAFTAERQVLEYRKRPGQRPTFVLIESRELAE
ncbi:hypothetical protein [Hymenobacter edaphi]|uniref:VCBS repeat-containing protein n=1 Tax=Hymenobacter edaphi TaxID=2211146 RepID=A0A328BCC5_9BACT|nr:hypothetical protein [Hymenobacter edaphi]RAK65160.1 hypothetical protein DLM85_16615 [Hymenobacter edaphi]